MKIITTSVEQTQKIAKRIGELLKNNPPDLDHALIISLEGDLGGGKTSFVQGLADSFGVQQKVLSPTFVIYRKYDLPGSYFLFLYHCDYYRLNEQENKDLNLESMIANPHNLVIIEWGDKIKPVLPDPVITIKFDFQGQEERILHIEDSTHTLNSLQNESTRP